jgi:putative nucleotidyltransferase with HDIG domain
LAKSTRRLAQLPPLASAVGATTWTLGVPIVAFALLRTLGEPTPAAAGATIVGASGIAAVMASLWWRTRSNSGAANLPDLLLWSWFRRLQAYRTIEQGEELLVESYNEQHVDLDLLQSLAGALEILDPYTHGHSQRVERLVRRTALALGDGLSEGQIDHLCRAAVLHDIGKMHVPDGVLSKNGPLTDDEWVLMQQHVLVGARLVAKVGEPSITEAVFHHHEAWDGSGYPLGLSGQDIPLFARIIAVADAYDAMVSARPYRASLGRASAIEILTREAGRQFDPRIVRSLISILPAPARMRVMVPLFGMIGRIGQDALAWGRRSGATALGPTVGSCAAAAVLSTALLVAPPGGGSWIGDTDPLATKRITSAVEVDSSFQRAEASLADGRGADRRGSARPHRQAGGVPPQSSAPAGGSLLPGEPGSDPEDKNDGPGSGGSAPGGGEEPEGVDPGGSGPGDGGSPDPGDGGSPDPGDGGSPDPGAPAPDDPGEGNVPDEPTGPGPGGPGGDPQPDKGKDCEVPPPSVGNDKHCGG